MVADIYDSLIAPPDFDERSAAQKPMGLCVGPKRSAAELDARYGGRYYYSPRCNAAVEFEEMDEPEDTQ